MNKYLLYLAVFGVVCALLAQQGEARNALKKRLLKSTKLDMSVVRDKLKRSVDSRKKRAAETPADKIRSKRSEMRLKNENIASLVKETVPQIQNIDKHLGTTRNKRAAHSDLKTRLVKKLNRANRALRKKRSAADQEPLFKSKLGKLNKIAKNLRRFQKK